MEDKPTTLRDKVEWLIENEGCEFADGLSGLQTFFDYCIPDEAKQAQLIDLVRKDLEYVFELTWEQHEYDMEQEEEFQKRSRTVAELIVSSMIGKGLIGEQDHAYQKEWIDKIQLTVENFA